MTTMTLRNVSEGKAYAIVWDDGSDENNYANFTSLQDLLHYYTRTAGVENARFYEIDTKEIVVDMRKPGEDDDDPRGCACAVKAHRDRNK
jgi:hypothetical protein